MNQVQSGESTAKGDNPGSKTRKTRKRQRRKKVDGGDELPLLQVDSSLIQRSGSQSSLLSVQSVGSYRSAVSSFSNASADAFKACNRHWELRLKQQRNIYLIKAEVQAMTNNCDVQNRTIKEGLTKIRELVTAIDVDHKLAKNKDELLIIIVDIQRGWEFRRAQGKAIS